MPSPQLRALWRCAPALSAFCALFAWGISVERGSAQNPSQTPSLLTAGAGQVITWDGTNGIAINSLVGADRFYSAGIWGQTTVSANVEAGRIWDAHEITSTMTDSFVAPGATGEFDWHATAVGSVLAGYDPNETTGSYPYYKLGIAPLTQLSSGAIASGWYNDAGGGVYFNTSPSSFYSAYNYYFTKSWTHTANLGGGISVQFSAPTDVVNSSWGFADPAAQDSMTMAAGGMARANPLTTLVVAAGNANSPSNPGNNVGGPASSPNVISVGAVGNGSIDQFTMVADFSSRGPQDYYDPVHGLITGVRAPVDLVAPGTSLVAAYYGGQTGGNGPQLAGTQPDTTNGANNYYSIGVAGTSFAAPIVSGGVSLLKSLSYVAGMGDESRDTRVIKSVLLNSATKLPGWDNGQHLDGAGVTVTTQSLDWAQGAGMLNLNQAFDQFYSGTKDVPGLAGGQVNSTGWDYGALQLSAQPGLLSHNDYPIAFTLQATAVLDVTLSWFRNLGNPVLSDDADPNLQSLATDDLGFANLDLEIWNADFTKLYASSMSLYNSVEELHFVLPETGLYGIRVSYTDQVFGTPVAETYGLAWDTVDPVPEPGTVALLAMGALGLLRISFRRNQNPCDFQEAKRPGAQQ